jgi:DNA-binding response OmpR family regulator
MKSMYNILVLDDNEAQLQHVNNLLKNDFNVYLVNNPIKAHKICAENQFDAILVDVHMPIINGFEFIKTLKSSLQYETALFILSSDSSTLTKLLALELGIKDFLWPDMQKEELILRIRNHIQTETEFTKKKIRSYKYLQVDFDKNEAYLHGSKMNLSSSEYKLLSTLIESAGKIVDLESIGANDEDILGINQKLATGNMAITRMDGIRILLL